VLQPCMKIPSSPSPLLTAYHCHFHFFSDLHHPFALCTKDIGTIFYISRYSGLSNNYVGNFCCNKLFHCFCICTPESIITSCFKIKWTDQIIQKVLSFFHPKFIEEPLAQSSIPCHISLIPYHTFCEGTSNAFSLIQDWPHWCSDHSIFRVAVMVEIYTKCL